MKKLIIQCITAILCTALAASACSSGVKKVADAKKKAAESIGSGSSVSASVDDGSNSDLGGSDNNASAPADSDASTPADSDATTPADSNSSAPADSTPADANSPAESDKPGIPSTKAEIVKCYNDAVNKAISAKAGYSKSRTTNLSSLEGAEAIMKIKVAREAVYSFLGVGTTDYKNVKGKAEFLSKSALTEADVKAANCTEANGVYTITLTLADGASSAPNGSDSSPLQRCGLFAGNEDKSDYDYKNANNIYIGLNNADGASVAAVKERTSNTKITAKINAATGQLVSLNASWNWDADLTDVKYVVKVSGTGHADTKVAISDFKW